MTRAVTIVPTAGGVGVLVLAAVAAAAALYVYAQREKLARAAADVADAINPLSPNNLAYRAVNSALQGVTGDSVNSLGTKIYEWTHNEPDPTMYTQAELERITAAGNNYGRHTGGWIVG